MAKQKIDSAAELARQLVSEVEQGQFRPVYLLMGEEPYYPVNDDKNAKLYAAYRKLADSETNVVFGGRLGEYQYYDMDAAVASALRAAENEKKELFNR